MRATIGLVAALWAGLALPAAWAAQDAYQFTVPARGWSVAFHMAPLTQYQGESQQGRFRLLATTGDGTTLSLFVEPYPAKDSEACRNKYWGDASRSPLVVNSSVKLLRLGGKPAVDYAVQGRHQGQRPKAANVPVYLAHGQACRDFHPSEGLYRSGFLADSIMLLSDVAIAVLFYMLLRPVSRMLALMAAAFRLTQAAVLGFNLLNYYAALLLLGGAEYAVAFQDGQRHALAMLFLDLHSHGYDLGLLFFGLSSLVLGYLVVRSKYLPGLLGYGLMAAAVVYLAGSLTRFLWPDYASLIAPAYILPLVAESAFCLWLLSKGIKAPPAGQLTDGVASGNS